LTRHLLTVLGSEDLCPMNFGPLHPSVPFCILPHWISVSVGSLDWVHAWVSWFLHGDKLVMTAGSLCKPHAPCISHRHAQIRRRLSLLTSASTVKVTSNPLGNLTLDKISASLHH
jgi:hypothetical protein